ncbi:hypothetical protein PSYPI_23427 [Pseudomonas syringae pv. pisi str. 1704B]|uniref:GGDEF domain-containing protein n=2 Tax=Pseudomonas syringae TaxID=317 RepID=F3GDH7_PSESJ|nr:hypothetical protein PSYPI_23427 [Pseudomonas syringae pv. pisi str. 1704B]
MQVDFNSDMGESFGAWTIGDGVDTELMTFISSANVATGFHAGDPGTMRRTIEQAKRLGVAIGAHPGFRDLVGFGRRHINSTPQELVDDMLYQLGALRELARVQGVALQHFKPHGALYMHLARDEAAARLLVENLQRLEPDLLLYCMPGSVICKIAEELGQPVIREFYADRDYDLSGSIVFTRHVRALDPTEVAARVVRACLQGLAARVASMEQEALGFRTHLEEQRQKALIDPLTGLPNRAAWGERLEQEMARWQEEKNSLLVCILDLDHFKRINDGYGHLAGDKVLKIVANVLSKRLRADDFMARFGGEEFVMLLPATSLAAGLTLLDELRAAVESCPFHFKGERVTITVSIGLTAFRPSEKSDTAIKRADQALYKAKENGRNRIEQG